MFAELLSRVSAGLLAALFQLCRGTKYKRFPRWLDSWLCRRKQLGLLSFLCAGLHAVYSMCLTLRKSAGYALLNAAYRQVSTEQVDTTHLKSGNLSSDIPVVSHHFKVKAGVENSWDEQLVWRSDLYLSCGILGFGVLSLLAITSLPSVGNALNWREFTFVQVRQQIL